jgi:hypothetical protein
MSCVDVCRALRWARRFARATGGGWSDEQLFQAARKMNRAESECLPNQFRWRTLLLCTQLTLTQTAVVVGCVQFRKSRFTICCRQSLGVARFSAFQCTKGMSRTFRWPRATRSFAPDCAPVTRRSEDRPKSCDFATDRSVPPLATNFALARDPHSLAAVIGPAFVQFEQRSPATISEAFFKPELVAQIGIDSWILGIARSTSSRIDFSVVSPLRNQLFPGGNNGWLHSADA